MARSSMTTESHGATPVKRQHNRFSGLFLAPLPGLVFAWVLHFWTSGIHFWVIQTPGSAGVTALLTTFLGAVSIVLAGWAYSITKHREAPMRWAYAIGSGVLAFLFAANVSRGPSWWLSGLFLIVSFVVASMWAMVRTNVARNDKKESDGEGSGKGILDRIGVSALTKFFAKVEHDPKTGEPVRIRVKGKHGEGETARVLQENLEGIESALASETGLKVPAGMSTAVRGEAADESEMVLTLRDPFIGHIPLGPLTNPGKSIAELCAIAIYADNGQPGWFTLAGGVHVPNASSYGFAGTSRSGKTTAENVMLTDFASRSDWCVLYLNQAKGRQDARPLLPITEAAVITEDGATGHDEYIAAMHALIAIMGYRQRVLGDFGVKWSPRCADPDPAKRPSRIINGKRVVMERIPMLTAHFGEADSILKSGRVENDAVFVASKGLSLGVNTGWSLQNPDFRGMPTNLRSNITHWFCYGVTDAGITDYVFEAEEKNAGIKPHLWGARKPGQHYMKGNSVEDSRMPTALKTQFIVGSETHPDGTKKSFDELDDEFNAELLRRNYESAKTIMKLDRGSAEATGGWWDEQVAKTDALRREMLDGEPATPQPATRNETPQRPRNPQPAPRKRDYDPAPQTPQPQPAAEAEDADIDPAEIEESMDEYADVARNTTEVGGVEIYGGEDGAAIRNTRLAGETPIPQNIGEFDPLAESAEDDKPAARSKEDAVEIVHRTILGMLDDPELAGRRQDGAIVTGPTEVAERSGVRSRPWVVEVMSDLLAGRGPLADQLLVERTVLKGQLKYRFKRLSGTDHAE